MIKLYDKVFADTITQLRHGLPLARLKKTFQDFTRTAVVSS